VVGRIKWPRAPACGAPAGSRATNLSGPEEEMDSFLHQLAQARPDPGGGAAAAYGARIGLALLEKVVRLEINRPRPAGAPDPTWEAALARLRQLRETCAALQEADVRAYFDFSAARASGDAALLSAAVREAVACPGKIMQQAGEALQLLAWAGERCQKHLISDLWVAGELLGAACRGAYRIAAANLKLVREVSARQVLAGKLDRTRGECEDLDQQAQAALAARGA
jgi:formiminotetrahydrofolate cyclodeaminase